MKTDQLITTGIVLVRRDFQEADRLLTVLTPDAGKIKLIAKGVRRPKSKLAGGIELFSVSDLTLLQGKGDFSTLISSRLITHYGHIVEDINRTMLGYELLKRMDRLTEAAAGEEYFGLLQASLLGLDDSALSIVLVELWFTVQLLFITGHAPNLRNDADGNRLAQDGLYLFDFDVMAFRLQPDGPFTANHIKLLRLSAGTEDPTVLKQVKETDIVAPATLTLASNILKRHVRV